MNQLYTQLFSLFPYHADYILTRLRTLLPKSPPQNSDSLWYKTMQLYITYPDAFEIDGKADFSTLSLQLDRIRSLGINAIHVLPFLCSPMVDAGFDISSFVKVREDLGGNEEFDTFVEKARSKNIHIFMDMILNHVSAEHPWFKKAVAGSKRYRNYFIHSQEKPKLLRKTQDNGGYWAVYEIGDREVPCRIIFPELVGELPHWIQGEDGYWYYHTFYPHQLDLDWYNPDVFVEFARIFAFWARRGVSFRLDAIPFVGKNLEKGIIETNTRKHQLVYIYRQFLTLLNPESVLLVEAMQPFDRMLTYFGTSRKPEAHLAYNFYLAIGLWKTMVSGNKKYLEEQLQLTGQIPRRNQWITFLRTHDELTLEYITAQSRTMVVNALSAYGVPFRNGYGVSGRLASLLGEREDRIQLAFFLLASLPGNPAIYYGDELGMVNDIAWMKKSTRMKRILLHDPKMNDDTRDINRARVNRKQLKSRQAQTVSASIATIYNLRQQYPCIATTPPEILNSLPDTIVHLKYSENDTRVIVYANLSNRTFSTSIQNHHRVVLSVNRAQVHNTTLTLPPYSGLWLKA